MQNKQDEQDEAEFRGKCTKAKDLEEVKTLAL